MDEYLRRARAVLAKFQAAVDAFDRARKGVAPVAGLNEKQLKSLDEIVERIRAAVKRLEHSLTQISGETALDVVDLQVRLEGETTALASALKDLGEIVIEAPDILAGQQTRIELDGNTANITAGGNGQIGDIIVRDSADKQRIYMGRITETGATSKEGGSGGGGTEPPPVIADYFGLKVQNAAGANLVQFGRIPVQTGPIQTTTTTTVSFLLHHA